VTSLWLCFNTVEVVACVNCQLFLLYCVKNSVFGGFQVWGTKGVEKIKCWD